VTQLAAVLDNRIILPPEQTEQNLCADKGYTGDPAKKIIEAHGYISHVKERGEEIKAKKEISGYRARRRVVELTHSWLNRFRKLLVRYEKLSGSYIALM
jgi:transposase